MRLMKVSVVAALMFFAATLFSLEIYASSLPELSPHQRSDFQQNVIQEIEGAISWMNDDSNTVGIDFSGNLELGTRLNAYRLEDSLEAITEIHWYPVLSDGRVVAIVSIHGEIDSPIITLRDEFATQLRHFFETNNDDFALLFESNRLYVITNHTREHLRTYYSIEVTDDAATRSRVFDLSEMQFSSIKPILELCIIMDELAVDARIPLAQVSLNVPIVLQGNTNLCWAASAASVGRFRTGLNRTAAQVAAAVGIDPMRGATVQETVNALGLVFGVWNRVFPGGPAFHEITTSLHNGMPIMVSFFPPSGMGHMVVFSGWFTSPSTQIRYMDPHFGFATITNPANGRYTIVVGWQTMTSSQNIR